jgi:hypothetical protein
MTREMALYSNKGVRHSFSDAAGIYRAVHPDRSENLDWYLPIACSIDDWNELELTDQASC